MFMFGWLSALITEARAKPTQQSGEAGRSETANNEKTEGSSRASVYSFNRSKLREV
jgi:hypothetical protein